MEAEKMELLERLYQGPFTGAELSDGFTSEIDEEASLQEDADAWSYSEAE